jgi:hypothetical protein
MRHVRHVLETLESRLLLDSHPMFDIGGEIEPNDTRETATPLPPSPHQLLRPCFLDAAGTADCPPALFAGHGALSDHEPLANSADVDFWSIRLSVGSSIGLRMEGNAAAAGVLPDLQGPDGAVVARSEAHDQNGDGVIDGTALEYTAETDGVYFIQVGPGGGRYALHAAVKREPHVPDDPHGEHEPNDTFETAQEIPLIWVTAAREAESATGLFPQGSGFVRGSLENGEVSPDTDFYSIEVRSDFTIGVRAGGAGASGGHLTIYDRERNVIADTDPNADGMLAARFESTYAGEYFIQLTDTGTVVCITTPCLTYELSVKATPTVVNNPFVEHEPNDTLDTANEIELRSRWWPCESIVCPLSAGASEESSSLVDPAGTGSPHDGTPVGNLRPVIWPGDNSLHGFITGELEFFTCPPEMVCIAVVQHGVDNFVFDVPAEQLVSVRLTGPLAHNNGVLTLLDSGGTVLTSDDDNSDGLAVQWRARDGGTLYARVTAGFPTAEIQTASLIADAEPCDDTTAHADSRCASPWTYRVDVTAEPLTNPIEGRDEHEPNDTMEQANEIELPRVGDAVCLAIGCPPAPRPGEHSRDRQVHAIAGGTTHDVDYFAFEVLADEQVNVGLSGARHYEIQPLANIVEPEPDAQPLLFVTVFDSAGNEIGRTGGDAASRVVFESILGGVYFARVELRPDSPDAEVADYRLHLHTSRFNHEGQDESEPNDTLDEADALELRSLPTFAPGIELRGGDARGIAGGPSSDQDVFSFEVQTGGHVTVGVTGFGSNLPDCPAGFASDGTACVTVHAASSETSERLPHFVHDQPIHVTVFDAAGNEVATSDGTDGRPHVVSFDSDAAGQYFAVVSVSSDTEAFVRYRLGVLAQSSIEANEVVPHDPDDPHNDPPLEIMLRHGQTFRYTDSDGDSVQVVFQGRGGTAHIMFDGSDANGSDIVSVDIAGVRKGGNFRVQTHGSADVGSLEIDGPTVRARARRANGFGNVSIDGNLGSFSSSLNLRSLAVDGILGEVYAPGRQIDQVAAMVFDHAMADVGSIRSLSVEEEMSSAIFELFLPEDEQP